MHIESDMNKELGGWNYFLKNKSRTGRLGLFGIRGARPNWYIYFAKWNERLKFRLQVIVIFKEQFDEFIMVH